MSSAQVKSVQRHHKEVEKALDETIEDTIRNAGPTNALAWTGVTVGAFVLNLLVLVLISAG